jgi:hypothetical protein
LTVAPRTTRTRLHVQIDKKKVVFLQNLKKSLSLNSMEHTNGTSSDSDSQLLDGLSITELFKNSEGLTYK